MLQAPSRRGPRAPDTPSGKPPPVRWFAEPGAGRWCNRAVRLVVLVTIGATAWLVAAAARDSSAAERPLCSPTPVRYVSAKHPTLGEVPWALAHPHAAGAVAYLPSYPRMLRDARVNRSDGLVMWATGATTVWNLPGSASEATAVVARRIDGRGYFRLRLSARASGLASTPRFPSPGCWRLTVRRGTSRASVVARVVARPERLGCNATPIADGSLAATRPRTAGIAGGWTWRTDDGGALLYTHGLGPGGLRAKVPWWIRRGWGAPLELTGIRLDGKGLFRQEFWQAGDPSSRPPGYRAVFPAIIDVPRPGCWLLRLRTARLAGVLVVRAIDR